MQSKDALEEQRLAESPHHAGATADGAALHLAARLVTFTVAALAGRVDVNDDFLVDALCCLSERQLHNVLYPKRERMPDFSNKGANDRNLFAFIV